MSLAARSGTKSGRKSIPILPGLEINLHNFLILFNNISCFTTRQDDARVVSSAERVDLRE